MAKKKSVGRPSKAESEKKTSTIISIDPDLLKAAKAQAKKDRLSWSTWVSQLIIKALKC